jgi:hypothetical protein
MATACCWGVESSKFVYPGMFGCVSTCIYTSYIQNELFVPKQQRDVVCIRGILLAEK